MTDHISNFCKRRSCEQQLVSDHSNFATVASLSRMGR